jgi:hypothetical protein
MAPPISIFVQRILRFLLNTYRSVVLFWRYMIRPNIIFPSTISVDESQEDDDGSSVLHRRRIQTGQAWDEFCDTLKAAGAIIFAPGVPSDNIMIQTEGIRYLSRLARAGLENFVECADPECPRLVAIANGSRPARVCIGSDNPDNLYENATIDSSYTYIVKGTRGTVPYLSMGTQSGSYGQKGGLRTVSVIHAEELIYDEEHEQSFTIYLSSVRPVEATNWLQLDPSVKEALFIVRQTFGDRSNEHPATINIARLVGFSTTATTTLCGELGRPTPLTAQRLDEGLQQAAVFVAGASAMFAKWSHEFQRNHTNQLPLFDVERSNRAGGDPNIRYYHSYWKLPKSNLTSERRHLLKIHFHPPQKLIYWNFQLNNHWMESLDYRHFKIHTNSALANPNLDGSFTIYIVHSFEDEIIRTCMENVRTANWLETAGHVQGTMCFRYVGAQCIDDELPHPTMDLVDVWDIVMTNNTIQNASSIHTHF